MNLGPQNRVKVDILKDEAEPFLEGSHGRLLIRLAVRTGWTMEDVKKLSGREVVTIMEELA